MIKVTQTNVSNRGSARLAPILLPLLLLLATALAKPVAAMSLGIGPKAGVNFAGADVDGVDNEDRRTGAVLGVVAEFGVTSPYSLVIEPSYLQRGADFEILGAEARGELDYFEIPVLAKAKFGNLRGVHAYLFLGPSLGLKMDSEGSILGFADPFEEEVATFTVSGQIGAGLAVRLSEYLYLASDLRYSHGFTNALEDDIGTIDSWYSRDIQASASLLFHLTE